MAYSTLPKSATLSPSPFQIAIPDDKLRELQTLLDYSKIAEPTYESTQEDGKYGITTEWITNAKKEWQTKFDWRTSEKHMNSFPNFKVPIHDIDNITFDIHFVALFSKNPNAIPIILLHGWPGSFIEFLPMLGLFREQYSETDLPYHLIVPSLPGYTFSSKPPLTKDFRIEDIARVMNKLMVGLGFRAGYVAQGGDIGSKVGRVIAAEYEECKACHINFCIMPEPKGIDPKSITAAEKEGLARAEWFHQIGSAYALEHATKPSTIGLVLATNPLALLIWIGEKFLDWTDVTPSVDTILESVTLYWLTESFPSSIYPYRQLFTPGNIGAHENPIWHINKPMGFSWFPKEIAPMPEAWVKTTGDLVFYRHHSQGGHFAALEQTEALKGDLVEFIEQVWKSRSK